MPRPSHPERIWIAAFLLALAFDQLFWTAQPGISFTLWVLLALTGLFLNAFWDRKRPSWPSYLLAALAIGLAATNILRAEPFSRGFNALLSLGCVGLLAATLLTGNWIFYRLGDYVIATFKLITAGLVRGAGTRAAAPVQQPISPPMESEQPAQALSPSSLVKQPKVQNPVWLWFKYALPYLRGLIIALPILAVLATLLASADPVFGERLRGLLSVFDLNRLPEYLFRFVYILFFTYIFGGLFLHAVLPYPTEERPDPNVAWKSRFLGSTECFVILSGVILLFVFFLALQFRYLFGGQANISETGYTYADYARRGFFELVWVSILTVALYLGLGAITRRENSTVQRIFSLSAIVLLALVVIILVSALQRLLLYEGAYGFTRLRTYTHIFIFWLGALLLTTIILEGVRKPGHFGLAFLIFVLGFGLTFTFLNLDGTITTLNVQRARAGFELDIQHVTGLSADAVPVLYHAYNDPSLPAAVRQRSGAALACFTLTSARWTAQRDWRGYNFSEINAARILATFDAKPFLTNGDRGPEVQMDGKTVSCYDNYGD